MDLVEFACTSGAFSELSSTERTILAYVAHHQEEVASATVASVARATFSSTTSVIRLSKKLGFAGFSELKFFIKNSRSTECIGGMDLIEGTRLDTVETVERSSQCSEVLTVVELIHRSRVVYLCATGYSQRLAAKEFMKSLINYGYFCVLIPSHLELENGLAAMSTDDVVVILSYSGATHGYESIVEKLRARGITLVSLVSRVDGYIAQASDHVLTYRSTPVQVKQDSSPFISLIGLHILLDYMLRRLLVFKWGAETATDEG